MISTSRDLIKVPLDVELKIVKIICGRHSFISSDDVGSDCWLIVYVSEYQSFFKDHFIEILFA